MKYEMMYSDSVLSNPLETEICNRKRLARMSHKLPELVL